MVGFPASHVSFQGRFSGSPVFSSSFLFQPPRPKTMGEEGKMRRNTLERESSAGVNETKHWGGGGLANRGP